jgi:hypothetical protein
VLPANRAAEYEVDRAAFTSAATPPALRLGDGCGNGTGAVGGNEDRGVGDFGEGGEPFEQRALSAWNWARVAGAAVSVTITPEHLPLRR